jgi:Carboxypeptidase regulatory-like domain
MKSRNAMLGMIVLTISVMFAPARYSPNTSANQTRPIYQPTGSECTITGKISFAGQPPQPRKIDSSADPVCEGVDPELFTEDVIVTAGKLANVFVYVRSGDTLEWYTFPAARPDVSIAHHGCRFVPHILGMQTQQVLKIANDDANTHNTHSIPKNNPDWNQSQPQNASPLEVKFNNPEALIPIKDNQHPWEKAYVSVLSHPFFAVSTRNGSYRIAGLPPGQYTVVAWHERFGEQSAEVSIGVNDKKELNFTFKKPED